MEEYKKITSEHIKVHPIKKEHHFKVGSKIIDMDEDYE